MVVSARRPKHPRVAEIIFVQWELPETRDAVREADLARLLGPAVASGLVGQWDDGHGRLFWYEAKRGPAERGLRGAIAAACGAAPATVIVNAAAPGRAAGPRP